MQGVPTDFDGLLAWIAQHGVRLNPPAPEVSIVRAEERFPPSYRRLIERMNGFAIRQGGARIFGVPDERGRGKMVAATDSQREYAHRRYLENERATAKHRASARALQHAVAVCSGGGTG